MSFFRAVIYLLIRSKIYQYIAYQRMELPKFADILINSISYALPLMRRSVAKQALNVILRGTRTNAIFGVGTA